HVREAAAAGRRRRQPEHLRAVRGWLGRAAGEPDRPRSLQPALGFPAPPPAVARDAIGAGVSRSRSPRSGRLSCAARRLTTAKPPPNLTGRFGGPCPRSGRGPRLRHTKGSPPCTR